jgi:ABC-type lipoprotein export system ATPase subunit
MSYESQPELNKFDVDSKKALLDRQQFMVTDLKRQVEALTVRSPVAGQIGQVQVPDRASIAKDAPLLTVVDLSALEVEIKIPESMARDLRPGMNADLEGDGRHWQGTVSGVSPEVVNGQVTARLRCGDDKPAGLRQSQRLAVRVLIDRRDNVLMVDRGSFMDQDGGGIVYLVHDNVAERHPVHLGAASIAKVEILEGLAEGDRIINGTDAFNNAERHSDPLRTGEHMSQSIQSTHARDRIMLKMTNLSKAYRTEIVETYALRDFSIHVREGEFVAVTGPSGSGKTTFLTIAGLLEEFSGGEYQLDGADVRGLNDNQRSRLRNEKIGFIFQAFNLIPDLNVADNVKVPLRYRSINGSERRRMQESLSAWVCPRARGISELGGNSGSRSKGALARPAPAAGRRTHRHHPDGAGDGTHRELHRDGATIVMVTHDPESRFSSAKCHRRRPGGSGGSAARWSALTQL